MKVTYLLSICFLLASCSVNSLKTQDQENLVLQAKAYAQQFNNESNSTRADLSKYSEGKLIESFYFDFSSNRIGHESYIGNSPYQQFLDMLKRDNHISYMEARRNLTSDFKNFFSSDCSNINTLLTEIQNLDIKYDNEMYSLDLDSPAYKYTYTKPELPIYYTIITRIKEHPITQLYQNTHKAIADCPHPKESGQL